MGISLVRFNENAEGEDSWLVRDEIFGPIINIIPVESIDAAVAYVNARPNPLALYVASASRANFERIVDQTLSGSAIWNDHAFVPIVRTLPFGGVGESGWGAYHGYDGFLTFSHRRAILEVPYWQEFMQKNRYATNASAKNDKMLNFAMSAGIPFSRPLSVEDERRALQRRRNRRTLYLGLLLVTIGTWLGLGSRGIASAFGTLRAKLGF
jgi:delta 1-pyrroline-5-carboxylate dehydrogenase